MTVRTRITLLKALAQKWVEFGGGADDVAWVAGFTWTQFLNRFKTAVEREIARRDANSIDAEPSEQ